MNAFPNIQYQIADARGFITPPWRDTFNRLWLLATQGESMASKALMFPAVLTTAPETYVTGAANGTRIDRVTASNTTAGAVTVNAYLVPTGQAPGAGNQVAVAVSVGANTSVQLGSVEGHVLEKGWTLCFNASSAAAITVATSGVNL